MKGIVFTEFLEMVELNFGLEVVDTIIENSHLPSTGAYTAVGTYDFNEMVQLLTNLSKTTNLGANALLNSFGHYLFNGLLAAHPEVVSSYKNPISLLYSIEDHIHIQVKKLYPDAQLPTFKILEKTDTKLSMVYASERGLYALAQGLIEKTFEHFNKEVTVELKLLNEAGTEVRFNITQHG
ncbi:Heme NO-binding domain-containing protein [Croceitalea dokdonensis DOKDO 023]|uniref:Heme NO-binding domain-containing protein n=1 Tax=Croceitalea dokdonensis DOKDO 023 TaxID=1300341 RepID=A0A0P7AZX7_9FLAO|nr:heme NO-binding domain-containing protein [Croceitalea dokdonensis]KPM31181.1 Heme NO-binding domain-containing protein [Croceitalea dokdonensis DOKDO 023]